MGELRRRGTRDRALCTPQMQGATVDFLLTSNFLPYCKLTRPLRDTSWWASWGWHCTTQPCKWGRTAPGGHQGLAPGGGARVGGNGSLPSPSPCSLLAQGSFTASENNLYGAALYRAVISERNAAVIADLNCLRICLCSGKRACK